MKMDYRIAFTPYVNKKTAKNAIAEFVNVPTLVALFDFYGQRISQAAPLNIEHYVR
jgi:hypothetical protein